MRKGIALFLICFLLGMRTAAMDVVQTQAELFGVENLREGLNSRAETLMDEYSPVVQADFGESLIEIFRDAIRQSDGYIKSTIAVMARIFAIIILCKIVVSIGNKHASAASLLAGSLAITACCISDVRTMIGLGGDVIEEINGFTSLLLPVMAAATTASGAPTSGGVIYTVSALFCDILIRLCKLFIVPMLYAFLALGLADAALGQNRLGKVCELIGWSIKSLLKTILYVFTGLLASSGVISGATDAAALKTAKRAISGMIPVVGGIVSDASASLLAGAGVLKSAIGTFGMLAVLAVFMLPFFRMGISYLGFKLTAALCGILDTGHSKLLDIITGLMGYMLAMVGSCTVMSLIACCCFVKTVTP